MTINGKEIIDQLLSIERMNETSKELWANPKVQEFARKNSFKMFGTSYFDGNNIAANRKKFLTKVAMAPQTESMKGVVTPRYNTEPVNIKEPKFKSGDKVKTNSPHWSLMYGTIVSVVKHLHLISYNVRFENDLLFEHGEKIDILMEGHLLPDDRKVASLEIANAKFMERRDSIVEKAKANTIRMCGKESYDGKVEKKPRFSIDENNLSVCIQNDESVIIYDCKIKKILDNDMYEVSTSDGNKIVNETLLFHNISNFKK